MGNDPLARSISNLERALDRLGEALDEPETNKLAIDGTIQRFEFAFELAWKALRRFLLHEGIETATPREALKQANAAGWIENEAVWLQMLKDRNESSHVYDEDKARAIYQRIQVSYPSLIAALTTLRPKLP